MNLEAARAEYWRLCDWRERWLLLANNKDRMRRMGGLQSQMDYVCERSQRANRKIGVLLRVYWAAEEKQRDEDTERALYKKLKLKFEGV